MNPLHALAEAVGVARIWHDVDGAEQIVADDMLAAILAALGYPADSDDAAADSLIRAEVDARSIPAMIVTEAGVPTPLPPLIGDAALIADDGTEHVLPVDGLTLPPIAVPGYYQLRVAGHDFTLAVAPAAGAPQAAIGTRKIWGPAIQIPSLRGPTPQPFGHFGHLVDAARRFAACGADAMMINPVHALFPGHGDGYSPYSPSSRLFLNGAMVDPSLVGLPALPASPGNDRIDWAAAIPQRLKELRILFDALDDAARDRMIKDSLAEGDALHRHALFDALDMHFRPKGLYGWRQWPAKYHDPDGKAARHFAEKHPREVEFHLFVQWLARAGLSAAQNAARDAGMSVGLLADLAVGVDTGGSDSWAMRGNMLNGLTIGAPPDPLGPHGQNWGLTSYSPHGLRRSGYAPWIAMLRATLARAGGLRIDHAFGLARLWVIPDNRPSSDGAYLSYPFADMMRLAALEAYRANALIVAEDLGTKPYRFSETIEERGMLGMRVLWFERAADDGFIGAQDYAPMSVAMTGTHDTATVAGWWSGHDLDWADRLGRLPEGMTRSQAEDARDWDRGLLWATIGGGAARPAPDNADPVVEAALRHIGITPSYLALAPLEDLLALPDQPNLPGTIDEHPNWRQRLSASLEDLLAQPDVAARIALLGRSRDAASGDGTVSPPAATE